MIVGEQEVADGTATVRDLPRDASRRSSPRDQVVDARRAELVGGTVEPRVTPPAGDCAPHYCGELRPERRRPDGRRCAAGWPAAASTASTWRSSTCATAPGIVQCVVDGADDLRSEYVVRVTGTVRARPEGTANPDLATGEVEVGDCDGRGAQRGRAAAVPGRRPGRRDETLRLRYRYVDLRRDRMQRNLRIRADGQRRHPPRDGAPGLRRGRDADAHARRRPRAPATSSCRRRLQPGSFYALPQSPQLFKQLLHGRRLDRYYQIARCLRDEDLRADRQFEFIQLDAEASFVDQDDVLAFISEAAVLDADRGGHRRAARRDPAHDLARGHGALRLRQARPALRHGAGRAHRRVRGAPSSTRSRAERVKGIRVPGGADARPQASSTTLTDRAKRWGAKGLVWMRVDEPDAPRLARSPSSCPTTSRPACASALGAEAGDLLLLVADDRHDRPPRARALRLDLGRPPVNEGGLPFLWVVDFPLFEGLDDDGSPIPAHHPFTMPHPDDLDLLDVRPAGRAVARPTTSCSTAGSWARAPSGSTAPTSSSGSSGCSGIGDEEAQAEVRLPARRRSATAPRPTPGSPFGIDRLVALLAGEENIREVIAFPKTQSGADPLTGAPTPVDPAQLAELGLRLLPRKA